MTDYEEIAILVAKFDEAVNRRRIELFDTLWSEDASWEIRNPMPMRVETCAKIIETWQQMLGGTKWLFRGSFLGTVTINGDTASGRWPCVETGEFADGTPYDNRAYYEDTYVRTDAGWRFRSRSYHYLWLSRSPLVGDVIGDTVE
ncbi:MAG: nuclear transport factor 2 family protein [Fimbriimonadaceae bacterium]|nr:nuclear transport factor 2 family protein [Fimbriimonadaceae bacterium]